MDLDLPENFEKVQKLTRRKKEHTQIEFTCKICNRKVTQKSFTNTFNFICRSCKTKQTNLRKYGKVSIGAEKAKETLKRKYGVSNPSQLDSVKEKRKNTFLEKYGVDNPAKSEDIKEKIKNTNIEKYGVSCTLQNENIKSKVVKTNIEKYGSECCLSNAVIRQKIENTNLERYGVKYLAQNKEIAKKQLLSKRKNAETHRQYLSESLLKSRNFLYSKISPLLFEVTCSCGNKFKWTKYKYISEEYYSFIPYCKRCCSLGKSSYEYKLLNILKNQKVLKNDRSVLAPKELDFYFPDKKLAIEFDGIFWHKDSKKTLEKYEALQKKGIRLINIFEHEWNEDKIKSIIYAALNVRQNVIYARNCHICEISDTEYKNFVLENHIQNYAVASIRLGLFQNSQLVQIMSFGKPRFNKKFQYEMIRECSKNGYSIVGGKEKLWKYFVKNYNPKSVISYCDKRFFTGDSYTRLGFYFSYDTKPSYFYASKNQVLTRYQCQKHKLQSLLKNFDSNLTESQNMEKEGYFKLYDFGQKVYMYNVN